MAGYASGLYKNRFDSVIDELPGDALKKVYEYKKAMNNNPLECAVFGQIWRGKFDVVDAYCYAWLSTWLNKGFLYIDSVFLDSEPFPDSENVQYNTFFKTLRDKYPSLIANFTGGSQGDDGTVKIKKDFYLNQHLPNGEVKKVKFKKTAFNLECGFTEITKTYLNLRMGFKIARWAYGSKNMVFMILDQSKQANLEEYSNA